MEIGRESATGTVRSVRAAIKTRGLARHNQLLAGGHAGGHLQVVGFGEIGLRHAELARNARAASRPS